MWLRCQWDFAGLPLEMYPHFHFRAMVSEGVGIAIGLYRNALLPR